jgi:quercetin dioxygenase-like cupin family protein
MAESVIRRPGEGGTVENPLAQVAFKVRGEQTGGRVTAFETVVPPGEGPPLHSHANEDESMYVIEGEMRFKLGDELQAAPTGSFIFVPRGAPHTWQNVGDGPARMLIHFTPSGMERFFDGFALVVVPDLRAFERVGGEVGMDVVGPPLAQSDPV